MLIQLLSFIAGLVLLYFGAEWLVAGSSRIARALGITPMVVGLTVVAFGTSAPELLVSAVSSYRGEGNVALGNVVGSNVLNVALILAICAIIMPLLVESTLIRREMPIMVGAAIAIAVVAWNGIISRVEGTVLLAAFVAYLWFVVWNARRRPDALEEEYEEKEERTLEEERTHRPAWNALLVAAGLAGLAGGAHLLVTSAVAFARHLGISDLVVGLTVVAIGTSLPELATSAIAAWRKEADIAVANVVGSNIFNSLLILGTAAVVRPLQADPELLRFEIPVSIAASSILVPFALSRSTIERWEGVLLLLGYAAFTGYVVVRALLLA